MPPVGRFTIAERNNALALLVFVAVAAMVSAVVDLAARRTSQAARASAEAETLSTLAGDVLRGEPALPALLDRLRRDLRHDVGDAARTRPGGRRGRQGDGRRRSTGPARLARGGDVGVRPVRAAGGGRRRGADRGGPRAGAAGAERCPRRTAGCWPRSAAQAAVALRQQRLAEAVAEAEPLAEADRTRTALLAAVSHDLRSPLASAKAAVTALRSADLPWSPAERGELLATADESLDRLTRLVENLLDMSRLQAGALAIFPHPVGLDDVLPPVLDELGAAGHRVDLRLPVDLPEVLADPGLLERILANVIANALRHSPAEGRPLVSGSALGDRVELRVVDQGPGVPEPEWDRIFVPFQRLGDRDNLDRRRARPRALPRAGRGDGRLARPRAHARRRADHGALAAGGARRPSGPGPGGGDGVSEGPRHERGRVLVVEDDPQLLRAMRITLHARGYDVVTAATGRKALSEAAGAHPGHRRARPRPARPGRRRGDPGPARLDQRADHRAVRADLRRRQGGRARRRRGRLRDQAVRRGGAAGPDPRGHPAGRRRGRRLAQRGRGRRTGSTWLDKRVDGGGREVRLTPTEWRLLEALVRHPGKLVGQRQLITEVWGPAYTADTSSLRLYLNRLRRKLEPDPSRPRHLITEPGMGYRFQP